MKRTLPLCLSAAAILAVTACQSAPMTLPPGEYESTHSSTNSYGTKTEQETKTKVYYDEYGNKRAVQEKETTTDPKGLFNKSTTKSTTTY